VKSEKKRPVMVSRRNSNISLQGMIEMCST